MRNKTTYSVIMLFSDGDSCSCILKKLTTLSKGIWIEAVYRFQVIQIDWCDLSFTNARRFTSELSQKSLGSSVVEPLVEQVSYGPYSLSITG